ncbi:MAG: ABC transporter permease [Pseudomonadota bacterium]|nr:ABC transporter permease [Pseudomonadota bacterium]
MLKFVAGRLISTMLTLVGVSIVIFLAIRSVPGSFEEVLVPRGTPEFRAALAARLGLDQPLVIQYLRWVAALLRGDFGDSLVTSKPVWDEFRQRIFVTAEIALAAMVIATLVGGGIGVAAGFGGDRRLWGGLGRVVPSLCGSAPDFVLGSAMLFMFSRFAPGVSVGKWVSAQESLSLHLQSVLIPAAALSFFGVGLVAATARHAVISVQQQDHVTAATLRGLTRMQIIRRHILRNVSIPVLTVLGIYLGYLLGGAVLIENLFSVPGFGRYLLQGIMGRDYPVVQAGVMLSASFFVVINMVTDIIYAKLDPRFRDGGDR